MLQHMAEQQSGQTDEQSPAWQRSRRQCQQQSTQQAGHLHSTHQQHLITDMEMRTQQQQQALLDSQQLQQVLTPPLQSLPEYTAGDNHLQNDIEVAAAFRAELEARAPTPNRVCAVCARHLPLLHTNWTQPQQGVMNCAVADIPSLSLLRKDAPGSARLATRFPRHGLTTITLNNVVYCLHSAGVRGVYSLSSGFFAAVNHCHMQYTATSVTQSAVFVHRIVQYH